MDDGSKIFSQAALNKLRSPEKLDMLLPITTPLTWMGLAAVVLLLFSVVLWSIFGSFTEQANGVGLIMDSGGVVQVTHTASGVVEEVYVHNGSKIHNGDLIARISQSDREVNTKVAQYRTALSENRVDMVDKVFNFGSSELEEIVNSEIRSHYEGVVTQIQMRKGQFESAGSPLLTLRLTQDRNDFTGVLYIPVDKAKRVKAGQTIHLAPNGVDVSLSGSLIGVVRSVSEYPVNLQDVEFEVANAQFAQMVMAAGNNAVMEVKFDLVRDETSESGYLWSSFVGEHKEITAGSFCTGSIIIERRPPIEKVFYKLSQWLRSR